jgi:two-component system response regulator NreC
MTYIYPKTTKPTLVIAIADRLKAELLKKNESDLGCQVLCTHTDGISLIEELATLKPSFLLLDPELSKFNFVNFVKKFKTSSIQTKLVILSSNSNPSYLKIFLSANGAGFIQKNCGFDEFTTTFKSILAGNMLTVSSKRIEGLELLTSREKDVWKLLTQAKSEKEIAEELGIKLSTVKTHKMSISEKLNIKRGKKISSFAANLKY